MASPGTGVLRGLRALTLAAAVVGISLVAHGMAGGAHPGVAPLVVIVALTALAVGPLTRREIAMPRLLGLLGAGQVVLHVAFEQCAALSAAPGTAGHHHPASEPLPWMIGAHAAVTLVVALVVRHGDALLWRLWRWLTGRRAAAGRPVHARSYRLASGTLPVAHGGFVRGMVRGRAPPVAV